MSHEENEVAAVTLPLENTYARLPERFFARVSPTPVRTPRLLALNVELAGELGLSAATLASASGVRVLAGSEVAGGSEPLAAAYAGHQFGHFVPQLGDGRAHLLGEVVAPGGKRYDLQLKGSGPTPFSRRGDGRAALGPVLREYVVSEAMHALGVSTTRALAAVLTGEQVQRERMVPGAVLTRVAASHVRVGTFQYFAARGDKDALRTLARYVMERHYPAVLALEKPFRALLQAVIERQAALVAQWMRLGFIHGVMNTDNMSLSGETIDYGPCAFMEAYEPDKVYSSIDQNGRYAYSNQPHAAHWNLTRLAEAMLPLLEDEEGGTDAAVQSAQEALATFSTTYDAAWLGGFRRKLGFLTEREEDFELVEELLRAMAAGAADFTLAFHRLTLAVQFGNDAGFRELFSAPAAIDPWIARWRGRLAREGAAGRIEEMQQANPVYIPRNHRVEQMIEAALAGRLEPFHELLQVCTQPFAEQAGKEGYSAAALPGERVLATFCGT